MRRGSTEMADISVKDQLITCSSICCALAQRNLTQVLRRWKTVTNYIVNSKTFQIHKSITGHLHSARSVTRPQNKITLATTAVIWPHYNNSKSMYLASNIKLNLKFLMRVIELFTGALALPFLSIARPLKIMISSVFIIFGIILDYSGQVLTSTS